MSEAFSIQYSSLCCHGSFHIEYAQTDITFPLCSATQEYLIPTRGRDGLLIKLLCTLSFPAATIYRQGSELGLLAGTGQSSGGPRRNEISWNPPWDSSICKRKLLAVQKAREKQPGLLRSSRGAFSSGMSLSHQHLPEGSATHAPASGLGQALENYAAGRGRDAAVPVPHASPGYAA